MTKVDIRTVVATLAAVLIAACSAATPSRTLAPGEPDVELPDPSTLPLPPVASPDAGVR
jgi:hypothetical protein